jgi:tape measure domain-containing protein
MTELATLGLSIRSDGVVVATDRLKDFEGAGRRADGVAGSLMRTAVAMGAALAGAFSVRALGGYADAWSDMQSRVGAAIKDMEAAPALMQRITDIANASYSPLEQTAEIYSRNAGILRDLGRGATEAADFTEALNHALVTTATRGERAASVQNALAKAMAVGKLAGDGLETVLTHGSRVAEALADELDTNVSGLRALASQGKITGDVIASALINRVVELREEAGQMDATLGDAGVIANNVMTEWVGRIDKAWQASGRLASKVIELALAFRGTADNVIQLGNVVGMALGPAFDMLGANMDTVAAVAGIAVAALAGFYAPAMIGGLWSLSAALVTGVAGGIKAITLAMLANPLGLLIGGLAAAVTAAFMFRDEIKQAIGVDVVEVVKGTANTVIGAFVGAYDAVVASWSMLPSALGDLVYSAAESAVNGVIYLIREVQANINGFLTDVDGILAKLNSPVRVGTMELMGYADLRNPFAGAAKETGDSISGAFKDAMSRDYVGEMAAGLGKVWDSAAGAGDAIGSLAGQLGEGGATGGQGLAGATKAANDNMRAFGDTAQSVLSDMYNTGKSVFSGFFSDLKSGLKDGQTFWEALGNAGANALDKIADRALSMGANGIFDMIFGSLFGGIGGNSLGGGWGVAGGFGRPGIFGIPGFANGTNSAPGGLAWVGERGPELVNLPRGSQVIPNGPSMALAANQNSGDIVIHNVINVPPGTSADVAPAIAREVTKELRRQLPDAMERYNRNPLRRAG